MIRTRPNLSTSTFGLVALGALILATVPVQAQNLTVPQASPHAVAEQEIGISKVTVDYHRPQVRDREIWGALVPYDNAWRAGANENTVVTFSHDVKVEGQDLAAGSYGLHMFPTAGEWEIAFSTNSTSWGSFSYNQEEDALRVKVKPVAAPFEEWLRFGFEDLSGNGATTYLHWEKLKIPFRVEVDTPEIVLAKARNDLRSRVGFQWQGWAGAANYALQNGIHLEEALGWAENAVGRQENGRTLGLQALLQERLGRDDDAAATLAKAVEVSTEAELNALGYGILGAGNTAKAIELFQHNVDKNPESWNVWDSLAEAQASLGDTKGAIKNYTKALGMAPDPQKPRIESVLKKLKGS
ncbi:MAG: DUF2911 domain-containing protein [Deltaproteobacteria bacterium]|nr:DUF2911 domain-containing protein [Deltaproteobacteria bacterium]